MDQQISEFENTTTAAGNEAATNEEGQPPTETEKQEKTSSAVPTFVDMSAPAEPIYDDPEEEQQPSTEPLFSEVVASTVPTLVAETEAAAVALPASTTGTTISSPSAEDALELQNNLSTLPLTGTTTTTVAKTETYMI